MLSSPLPTSCRLPAALIFFLVLVLVLPSPAGASTSTRVFTAVSVRGGLATFKLTELEPAAIRRARVAAFGRSHRVSLRRVRAGARRGWLRARVASRAHWRRARTARKPRLVVTTSGRPRITITDRPSDSTVATDASFSFSTKGATASDCKLDAGAYTACSSPHRYQGLSPGTHTFTVKATNSYGSATASARWTITSSLPGSGAGVMQPAPALGPVPADARYVSPTGSDANPGTASSPWLTLAKAIDSVRPGDTVVLRTGTYGSRGTTNVMDAGGTSSAPVTFRGQPGEPMPTILGHVKIAAAHQRLDYILFDGPTGTVKPLTSDNPDGEQVQIAISGSSVEGVEISGSEIRNSGWHAGIYLSCGSGIRITGNYIHDNGDWADPIQENTSHGIYWTSGSGLIANNVIEHNVARGIQLYKAPRDVTVANNTIVRNGRAGIQFANDTAGSLAVNNIVAFNGWGIRSASLVGTGNAARSNLAYGNGSGNFTPSDGLALSDNMEANPGFVGAGDYHLAGTSPAIDAAADAFAPILDFDGLQRAVADLGALEAR